MIPTYIIHHPPLVERKQYLQSVLPWAQFIESPTRTIKYEKNREFTWKIKLLDMYSGEIPYRELLAGDLDCTNKHYTALKEISNLSVPGLILEDDAILLEGFWKCLQEVVQEKNSSMWDVLFIGGAFPHTVAPTLHYDKNSPFVLKGNPCSNTACSYIVKPWAATALAHRLFRDGSTLPIDFEMNYLCSSLKLKVCHFLPYVVQEGSSAGYYQTSQQR